jgi:ubiquinone/menaquinone biosynthesis C-methylase UbiE
MRETAAAIYRCPYTNEALHLQVDARQEAEILSGSLLASSGRRYPIVRGIPRLIHLDEEPASEAEQRELEYYESSSDSYDAAIDWLFSSFYEDESTVRQSMLEPLGLQSSFRVLEVGCGTCRDSRHIAQRLGDGQLFLQDLSPRMLALGVERMQRSGSFTCQIEYSIGHAAHLPFGDGYFDAAFHFGGLNLFSDRRQALRELTRVVRHGGRIAVGDESLAPWLRDTTYGQILLASHPLYRDVVPLDCLPLEARDVHVRWFLGDAFYLMDFEVGEGPPRVDLDLPIPGPRGGTHRTRFYGLLEGVSAEAKEMAVEAARREGMSQHEWLERAVRAAAKSSLER